MAVWPPPGPRRLRIVGPSAPQAARDARDDAMRRAERAAHLAWVAEAERAILDARQRRLAAAIGRSPQPFTTDLRERLRAAATIFDPGEMAAMHQPTVR
jgi:hypothetical protein